MAFGAVRVTPLDEEAVLGNDGDFRTSTRPTSGSEVVGVTFEAYLLVSNFRTTQKALDALFRTALARNGYDVGGSAFSAEAISLTWRTDPLFGAVALAQPAWISTVLRGPQEVVGASLSVIRQAPTAADAEGLPTQCLVYRVVARPKGKKVDEAELAKLRDLVQFDVRGPLYLDAAAQNAWEPRIIVRATVGPVAGMPNDTLWVALTVGTLSLVAAAFQRARHRR